LRIAVCWSRHQRRRLSIHNPPSAFRNRPAFTLIEAAVSSVIVAVMLIVALNTAASARAREQKAIDRQRGVMLAQELMSEILDKAYIDPGASPVFGPESGETRSTYNDVDDYNGLSESPPKNAAGTAISFPQNTRWSRSVVVQWVTSSNLNTSSATETYLKKITVTVKKNGIPVAELNALRSKAKDSL
jgi:MSHA pilin protein MshD